MCIRDSNITVSITDAANNAATCTAVITVNAPASDYSINDVSMDEGNSGTSTMAFTVTRTDATCASSISYGTSSNTATVGTDYLGSTGTLNFAAGELTQTIAVSINGDTDSESDETFDVTLSAAPANATISDATGTGTILDDDLSLIHI